MAITLEIERARDRIRSSENMHNIIADMFTGNYREYMEHPDYLVNRLKECILPFRKTSKSLNSPNVEISHGDFVRIRCMIQDCKGFEMFSPGVVSVTESGVRVSCGLLRDSVDCFVADGQDLNVATRHKYVICSVPGASTWFNEVFYDSAESSLDEIESESIGSDNHVRKFIAKFFDDSCAELKPNRVFDLFGVMDTTNLSSDFEVNSSTSNFPRLHVISFEPVEDYRVINQGIPLMSDDNPQAISGIRKSLRLLLGDGNAAEYLFCHLISKTYTRPEGYPVCSMPMNLINVTDSKSIVRHLRLLMPKVKVLEISEETLCNQSWTPKMDYETDILEGGPFQLSSGTVLVIDETKFSWQLVEKLPEEKRSIVMANLSTLRRIVKEQVFEYDYTHYPVILECDINVLVLSKEVSRLHLDLPFTVAIPPQFCDGIDPSASIQKGQFLKECRHALQICRNNVSMVTIPEEINKEVVESFVQDRESNATTDDACDQLHRLLTLSRLLSSLESRFQLDLTLWKKAQYMEKERAAILREFSKTIV